MGLGEMLKNAEGSAVNEKEETMERKTYAYVHYFEKHVVKGVLRIKFIVSDSDKKPTKTIEGTVADIIEFLEKETDGELFSEDGKYLYKVIWTKKIIPSEYVGGRPRTEREKALRRKPIRTKK